MRAANSPMPTQASSEQLMSRPDYEQNALHHSYLLVLLRGVGAAKPRSLQRIFDKVRRVNNVKITDSVGTTRDIWVRYIHDHPVENNDWGDFQTHRRLLGLITIGKFDTQTELNELCRQHESLKVRYSSTLYDSRALFFGPAVSITANDVHGENHISADGMETNDTANIANCYDTLKRTQNSTTTAATTTTAETTKTIKPLQDEYTTPSNFKSQAFFYREHDTCVNLENLIADFISSLFWVLESKRLERSREKVEKFTLLYAPFEKRDFVGLDMDSRQNRKRCAGRVLKNLADLTLQAGMVEDSLSLYHNSCETLSSIGDALWTGAAEEGLCAASAILLYPHLRERGETLLRRPAVLDGSPEKLTTLDSPHNTKVHNNTQDHIQSVAGTQQMTSASSSCSSVSSILTNSSVTGTSLSSSSSTSTISAATHTQRGEELPPNILKPEELPLTFRRAIINYSKYRHAAIVETEAALKAARICIEQRRPLDVAMFLQNILSINMNISEQERVKRYEVITELYKQIGYRRKAAFFQRLAALGHVQQGNPNPDWTQTYRLILGSFPGYLLSLDPLEVLEKSTGWPALQIDLMQHLITAARRLGHSALATRHMTYLLQTQWANMTATEQSDMALQLQNLSAQCEGSPVPLVLENGTIIPPANLTDLPFCIDLVVKDLAAHLRPQRIKVVQAECGPFLFTPIHFSSIDRREKKKDKNKIGFFWVQGNLSEITVRLRNPLPFELVVSDMRLLTNGIVFESLPQTVTLQPQVPTYVTLHGTPIEVGQLEIQGYSTHTLGVKSNCHLKDMRGRKFPPNYLIDVIPALPSISATTSLPQTAATRNLGSADNVITTASLTLYNGESSTCVVTIINDSTLPVEHLEVNINSNLEQEVQRKVFQINDKELQAKLPIQPKTAIEFTVHIFGEADFICPIGLQRAASVHSSSGGTGYDYAPSGVGGGTGVGGPQSLQYSTYSSSGHASLPTHVNSSSQYVPYANNTNHIQNSRRHNTANASFRSTSSANTEHTLTVDYSGTGQSLTMPQLGGGGGGGGNNSANQFSQHVEAQFRIKYSGGEAMLAGYCRQCAIVFNLELLPSAQITQWDVLPAEIPTQFYLVLDVTNQTTQEMSLNYTPHKNILIEAKESCRVPIPVERCSLDQISAVREAEYADNMEKDLYLRTQMATFSESVIRFCSRQIAERVKLDWSLSGTDIRGVASLRGIMLSPAMIDLTTVSPLQWTVLFKNAPIQPQSEIVFIAGESATISINVRNQSTQPLRNLVLTIKFYQDYLNGMENYNLETRVAISGPNRVSIPVLERNESAHHECAVIFFTPGRFKTSIQCHSKPTQTTQSNTKLNNSNIYINGQLETHHQKVFNHDILNATIFDEHQEHIWKFIPPIEVTVVEV